MASSIYPVSVTMTVLKITQRVYVLRTGQISFTGPADALGDDVKLREVYL
ncbi:MAG: hypothetical protein ABSC01_11835 [Verrucomicrobiota bacterium]|jgi:ABC-type branched-subunit amino acid transport system ATPase component